MSYTHQVCPQETPHIIDLYKPDRPLVKDKSFNYSTLETGYFKKPNLQTLDYLEIQHKAPPTTPWPTKDLFEGFINNTASTFETILQSSFLKRCSWSSMKMADLLEWRNSKTLPDGCACINKVFLVGKAILTEILQPFLFVSATVESIAYGALWGISTLLNLEKDRGKYQELYGSSTFTMLWAPAVAVHYNFFLESIPTDEGAARRDLSEKATRLLASF